MHPPLATAIVLNKTVQTNTVRHRPTSRKNPNTARRQAVSPSVPSLTFRSAEGSRSCEENASHARASSHCTVNEVSQEKPLRTTVLLGRSKHQNRLHFWLKKTLHSFQLCPLGAGARGARPGRNLSVGAGRARKCVSCERRVREIRCACWRAPTEEKAQLAPWCTQTKKRLVVFRKEEKKKRLVKLGRHDQDGRWNSGQPCGLYRHSKNVPED